MVLTLVLGMTVGALGFVLVRQFVEGVFEDRGAPALPAESFPRLAPPTRVRPTYRPLPARRAA